MKYNEVSALREEILQSCKDLFADSIEIGEIKVKNRTIQSYQLYISNPSFSSTQCLKDIAKKHHLTIRQQNGITILFKPMLVAFVQY